MKNIAGKRKYSCNYNYFDCIDTNEKAYWFGFLMADGCIMHSRRLRKLKTCNSWQDRYLTQLSLAICDYEHLEKFKKAIQSNHPINTYNVGKGFKPEAKYVRLIIEDEHLFKSLENLGLVQRKSNKVTYPDPSNLPEKFDKDFIRGFYDGNGMISCSFIRTCFSYEIGFCSTYEMLQSIFQRIPASKKNFNPVKRWSDREANNWAIKYGGNLQTSTILDWLYQYSTEATMLKRKYNKYLELKELIVVLHSDM